MKKHKLKIFYFIYVILTISQALSQQVYISPVPGSEFHNPETSILLTFDSPIKLNSFDDSNFIIHGSNNVYLNINAKISDDKTTIIIHNKDNFEYGETVNVKTRSEIELENGSKIIVPDFSFQIRGSYFQSISSQDNEINNSNFKTPDNFPSITVNINNEPANGKIFFYNISALATNNDRFYAIIENNGIPFFARQDNDKGLSFTLQKNGYLTYWNNKNFYMLDSTYSVIDSFACSNGYETDWHELQVMENGHAFVIAYDLHTMSTGTLDENIKVEGLIIQELDENKNVIFQWRNWDHLNLTDYTHSDTSSSQIFFIHGNAIEIDNDDNILASLRAMNQIIKIDRITGEIIWRLGGINNEFTFINDDGFCGQHDIRRLPNGNITLYDNGTCHNPTISKAKEYELDEINKTATLVWEYEHPKKVYAAGMGNVQRLSNGNTFINWGQIVDTKTKDNNLIPAITEVRPDKSIAYELTFDTFFHLVYRAYRFEWDVIPPDITNTNNFNVESFVKIYPNPVNDYFTINFNQIGEYSIQIFNSSGILIKALKNINADFTTIETSSFSPGLYYCRISSNNLLSTEKIIIVR